MPLTETGERTIIPTDKISPGELVFRVDGDIPEVGLADRDLLIVEPRANGDAATGEFVIATLDGDALIGLWLPSSGKTTSPPFSSLLSWTAGVGVSPAWTLPYNASVYGKVPFPSQGLQVLLL